jgi:hypothetical protein
MIPNQMVWSSKPEQFKRFSGFVRVAGRRLCCAVVHRQRKAVVKRDRVSSSDNFILKGPSRRDFAHTGAPRRGFGPGPPAR